MIADYWTATLVTGLLCWRVNWPVWRLVCSSMPLLLTNSFLQYSHWNCLVSPCSVRWMLRLCLFVNDLPHTLQEWGRTPVWFNMWILREYSFGKVFPQMSQTNSRLVCGDWALSSSSPSPFPSEICPTVGLLSAARWLLCCLCRARWGRSEAAYWNSLWHSYTHPQKKGWSHIFLQD